MVSSDPESEVLAGLRATEVGNLNGAPQTVGSNFDEGHSVFLGGRWIFPETLFTTRGMIPVDQLELRAGCDKAQTNKDSDAHWFEAWADGELVKRAACVEARGIEISALGIAGQIG